MADRSGHIAGGDQPGPSRGSYLPLAQAYVRANLNAQLEYRSAFASQVLAMFLNDAVWVAFWMVFYARFPVLRGWTRADTITIWALGAAGFGLAGAVCGNASRISQLVVDGQLDAWLLYPRSLLPHLILGRMSAPACGDVLFGFAVYLLICHPGPERFILFTALGLSVALLFLGVHILAGSLSFFLGNGIELGRQWTNAVIAFVSYPSALFEGPIRFLLFTAVPAGFVTYYPVRALRDLSLLDAGYALAGAVVVLALSVAAFYQGLRRYASGNLLQMTG